MPAQYLAQGWFGSGLQFINTSAVQKPEKATTAEEGYICFSFHNLLRYLLAQCEYSVSSARKYGPDFRKYQDEFLQTRTALF